MILVSPWARRTTDGRLSPKDYPFWPDVVGLLKAEGREVWQLSLPGEPDVPGCDRRFDGLPLPKIREHILACEAWASVDNFFQHFAWSIGRRGVVVFGPSDPVIFGHPENLNMLKDRSSLRPRQFGLWSEVESFDPKLFPSPAEVARAVLSTIPRKSFSSASWWLPG